MTIKCLITAGCSFSQVPNRDVTWPVHLNEALNPEKVYYLGQGAAGNGIISRKVLYHLTEAQKTYSNDEILVGIMWSGYDRRDLFSFKKEPTNIIDYGCQSNQYRNPCAVIEDANYNIVNRHWHDELTESFNVIFRDEDCLMVTLEHILRIQWLLKLNNIKYFMVPYDFDVWIPFVFGDYDKFRLINSSKDLEFLYNQIDFSCWLPIENMYDYAKFESSFDFAVPNDPHPSTEQHKEMVEKVLLPFLKTKYNIE